MGKGTRKNIEYAQEVRYFKTMKRKYSNICACQTNPELKPFKGRLDFRGARVLRIFKL